MTPTTWMGASDIARAEILEIKDILHHRSLKAALKLSEWTKRGLSYCPESREMRHIFEMQQERL